ncbi:AIG_G0043730.mRNA.1.CDS.1 [Saccharomyces cerevisiae]|nr:AIG_G0043730.mRNA.1.CDS.1 [Saccharomyces cerevisiae]CAI6853082.1 AIG_G0043730.mRNA.1.CDS.1 [Saccharomyces cerevisiae]
MKLLGTSMALIASVAQIVDAHATEKSDDTKLNQAMSLPDLISSTKVPKSWTAGDSSVLEEGRIILTPQRGTKGSLWQKENYKLEDSFTLEWTFRSVNYEGKSEGGLSFWFLSSNSRSDFKDKTFIMDLQSLMNVYDRSLASCLMGYQDSSVPSTLRLTYDRSENNLLKLQINNKICFRQKKVQFPAGEYRLGVTAENANTPESFEILKMEVYNGPIEDSYIPNVNEMGQPRVLTKVIDKETGQERLLEKEA